MNGQFKSMYIFTRPRTALPDEFGERMNGSKGACKHASAWMLIPKQNGSLFVPMQPLNMALCQTLHSTG